MKIKEIWFDADYIFGKDEEGKEYKQSLIWYPRLRQASDTEGCSINNNRFQSNG